MGEKKDGIDGRMPNILKLSEFKPVCNMQETNLEATLKSLTAEQRKRILSGADIRRLADIFDDAEMMRTAESFFANGMNVSATARALYMHRNTLMYRLKNIYTKTGLNLQNFEMAVTFKLLFITYKLR